MKDGARERPRLFLKNKLWITSLKKPKCYNCKFASEQFKAGSITHVHCLNRELYPIADLDSGKFCAWDTLRNWYDTCEKHEHNLCKQDDTQNSTTTF